MEAKKPATAVFDKGRRGNPLPGCDCVQCFGYCMINGAEVRVQKQEKDATESNADWHETLAKEKP